MQIIISIKPRIMSKIINGSKKIEIRSRRMNVIPGTLVWLYSSSPEKKLIGYTFIEKIEFFSKKEVWNKYKSKIGISKVELDEYSHNSCQLSVIHFQNIYCLNEYISLVEIRSIIKNFNPPQFFKILQDNILIKHVIEKHNNQMQLTTFLS